MSVRLFDTYSQAIIAGLDGRGITSYGLRLLIRVPESRMAKILAGRAEFSDLELSKIEKLTGKTSGQLAAAATEPNGGHLTDLFNSIAELSPSRVHPDDAPIPKTSGGKRKSRSSKKIAERHHNASNRTRLPAMT